MKIPDRVPVQESSEQWLNVFLLRREIEIDHLNELTANELDRVICETTTIIKDSETSRGKRLLCGYFYEKAMLIRSDRLHPLISPTHHRVIK